MKGIMDTARKITVEIPIGLLEKANEPAAPVSPRPSVRDCNWLRPRKLTLAYDSSEEK